jgi:two-component system response regulator
MNERDVRLLFNANHWSGATVKFAPSENGWLVELNTPENSEPEVLTLKRGNPRIFKTSDTALHWCRDMGFTKIFVQLHKMFSQENAGENTAASILLVEDDSGDIELTLRAIQRIDAHFDIIVCRDGLEALDFLFGEGKYKSRDITELPQLILLDLNLPKINGHEVLRTIRSNKITKYIPVVILSSSDESNDVKKGYELGNNSYVRKPVDYEEFCNTIKTIGQYWLNTNLLPPNH